MNITTFKKTQHVHVLTIEPEIISTTRTLFKSKPPKPVMYTPVEFFSVITPCSNPSWLHMVLASVAGEEDDKEETDETETVSPHKDIHSPFFRISTNPPFFVLFTNLISPSSAGQNEVDVKNIKFPVIHE